tara:strand:+ start:1890 stop:2702 length:813 start_codon:yes stop_codon:yes gene_type:complete
MSNRINSVFSKLKTSKTPAFIPFVTAGDPNLDLSFEIIKALATSGADIIEIGMPFSDPMADGKVIQDSSLRALKSGTTLSKTIELIKRFRIIDKFTPIVLMGYYNPIYNYGINKFLDDAKNAGIDGLIIVDLPPEHDDELCLHAIAKDIDFIRLVAPTTNEKRLKKILTNTSGFVYCISITGITGTKEAQTATISETVKKIRKYTDLPIAVGFGIKTVKQASTIAKIADAAVIGSTIVEKINLEFKKSKLDLKAISSIKKFLESFAKNIH